MSDVPFVRPSLGHRIARWLGPLAGPVKQARNGVGSLGTSLLAEPIAVLVGLLPLRVRLRVLERQSGARRKLDFAAADLFLEVRSEGERKRLRPCAKEPETVEWLMGHAGSGFVLYDVGANVGAYSLVAASLDADARVLAFEPGYTTFPRLVDNLRVNRLAERVTPLPLALGEQTEVGVFSYASLEPGNADHPGIGSESGPDAVARHAVLCYRLDDLLAEFRLPHPTLLKLDVDGAELAVLRGASNTLREQQLRSVLVEVREDSTDARQVASLLEAAGFRCVGGRLHDGGAVRNQIWDRR